MSDDKRISIKKTTPKGIAVWPKLDTPDTKFDAEGVYTVKLKLTDEEAAPYVALIDKLAADHLAKVKAACTDKVKLKKIKLTEDMPYKPEYDKDGNETGHTILSFKMKASGVSAKTKKPWTRKPALFDAKGEKIVKVPNVGGGSLIRVSCEYMPWDNPKGEVGTSARLEGVQIIKLCSFGDRSASEHGFGAEDDGYEAETGSDSGFADETPDTDGTDAKNASDF